MIKEQDGIDLKVFVDVLYEDYSLSLSLSKRIVLNTRRLAESVRNMVARLEYLITLFNKNILATKLFLHDFPKV